MDNSKRSVHNSGPLGMLVKTGQVKKINLTEEPNVDNLQHVGLEGLKSAGSYFKTQSGIQFNENELVLLDPKECEPWEYANRSQEEMGELDELIKSIRETSQLQPALVRTHPVPHDGIKYQIIFGRRRHAACLKLGIKLLVIRKDNLSLQEAISCQNAENKYRQDVSNYSNAVLYKKLLANKAFETEKELAEKLGISSSTLSDLMAYTKIPIEILDKIPNIHKLSTYMALKITRLLSTQKNSLSKLIDIAPQIGITVNTPAKLESLIKSKNAQTNDVPRRTQSIQDSDGNKLFTFKIDHKGVPQIIFQKSLLSDINFEQLCIEVQHTIEELVKSGRPDLVN